MNKRIIKLVIALSIAIFLNSACATGGFEQVKQSFQNRNVSFLMHKHWNMGKGEHQLYTHKLKWYGTARTSQDSLMVLVKEPWDSARNVKVGYKHADTAVLKYSIHDFFKTGTYNYSFKADMFFNVHSGDVVKYVMGSHDGCGNHFMRYDRRGDKGVFTWHSYWNGHGMITRTIDANSFDTFFDALPAYLRFRLKEGSYSIRVVQPLIANRPIDIKKPKPHLANQGDAEKRGVPHIVAVSVKNAPATLNGKKVIMSSVKHGKATDVFYFDAAFPHTLIKMKGKAEKNLRASKFFKYWVPANRGKPAP